MNSDMQKALVNLIDETLGEIEELKKSDRFSASEVELGDSKSGIKDMDKDGKLDKEEDKKDEEEKDEDKDMDKAEGKNSEADPNAGHHQVAKGEDEDEDEDEEKDDDKKMDKAEGKNREADPMSKMEDRMSKMESMMEKMEAYMGKKEDMEKSVEETSEKEETLEKSTSDRIDSLEKSLAGIAEMIKEIADAPVPAKSVSYKDVQPLKKSQDAVEPLTKSDLVEKLFELKKSGTQVDSLDITSAELGSPTELVKIANKYNIQ